MFDPSTLLESLLAIPILDEEIFNSSISRKDSSPTEIALSAIFINIWPLAPTGNFFNNWLSIFYFYPIGFYLFFNSVNEKKIS